MNYDPYSIEKNFLDKEGFSGKKKVKVELVRTS